MKVCKIVEDYNKSRKGDDRKLKYLHDAVQMYEALEDDDEFFDMIKGLYKL